MLRYSGNKLKLSKINMSGFTCQCHNLTFMEDWKGTSPEKKAIHRDEINKEELISRCQEIGAGMLYDTTRLDVGDFMIARIFWNIDEKKYHDHWAFLERR